MCADISKCSGEDCPVKEKCYRFTATASEYRQSYFFKPPLEVKNGVVTCEMYWGDQANSIWKQLKDITDDK
jgi:hypothetical protein